MFHDISWVSIDVGTPMNTEKEAGLFRKASDAAGRTALLFQLFVE